MKKLKVLIVTSNSLHNGPRLIREIDTLKADFDVVTVGATPPHDAAIPFIDKTTIDSPTIERLASKIVMKLWGGIGIKRWPLTQMRVNRLLSSVNPDIVIIHYPKYFPYFFSYPNRAFKVVYNAHEYHPLEFEDDAQWMKLYGNYYAFIYQKYLHQCDLVINVSNGIAAKCLEEYGVQSTVIPNAAAYFDVPIQSTQRNGIFRFIHHGGTNPDRKIERMIDAFEILGSGFELHLMLVNNKSEYFNLLEGKVKKLPNVFLIPPVSFDKIIPTLTQFDAGVYLLPASSFNNKHALPNKFFEFVQARLPIIIGPSIEMETILNQYKIGMVCNDFTTESLVSTLQGLSYQKLDSLKQNADIAAKELAAETYQLTFLQKFKQLSYS
jgi:glycosyltransferase involved in cell wall biosynthesis